MSDKEHHWSQPVEAPLAKPLNPQEYSTLLPEQWARTVSSGSSTIRGGLTGAALLSEGILNSAQSSATSALEGVRSSLVGTLSSIKSQQEQSESTAAASTSALSKVSSTVSKAVDSTADTAISSLNSLFSFANLLTFGTYHVASSTMRFSFQAASETVNIFNTLFGSTETSRAVTHLVFLVQQEILLHDPAFSTRGFFGNAVGAAALTGGITKALTAYACLQVMTKERTMQARKVARLIEESVQDGEDNDENGNTHGKNSSSGGLYATATGAMGWIAGGLASGVGIRGDPSVTPPISSPNPPTLPRVDFEARQKRYQWQRGFKSEQEFLKAMETVHRWNESFNPPGTDIESPNTRGSMRQNPNAFKRFSVGGYVAATPLTVRNTSAERPSSCSTSIAAANSILDDVSSVTESDVFEDAKSFISMSAEDTSPKSSSHSHHSRSLHKISMQSLRSIFEDEEESERKQSGRLGATKSMPEQYNAKPSMTGRLFDYVKSWIPSAISEPQPLYNSTTMPGGFAADIFEEATDLNIEESLLEYSMGVNTVFDQITISKVEKNGVIRRVHRVNVNDIESDAADVNASTLDRKSSISSCHTADSKKGTTDNNSILSTSTSRLAYGMGRHFPMINLVDNLVRYSKYATASYGSEFMTVFDVGNIRKLQRVNDPNVPMNHVSFATHVNVPVLDVLYSSSIRIPRTESGSSTSAPKLTTLPPPEESIEPVAHYISLDREAGVVVVTLRGTLSLSDLVLDLKFDYAEYKDHLIHAGILHTTQLLNQPASPFFLAVQKALLDNPSFGLVLVGHSLGGGVATLLAYEWSTPNPLSNASAITPFVTSPSSGLPPQRPIHVYSFGTPCIVDYALSTSLKGLATTVINGDDMIPTMSVGLIRDLKTVTFHLLDPVNQGLSEKIISRTLGLQVGSAAGKKPTEEEEDFFFGVISELRSSMKNDRLYPSGSVYWMNHSRSTTKDPTAKDGYTSSSHVVLRRCEDVREICHEPVFSSKMMSDHIPKSYEECVEALHRAMTVARKKSSV